MLIKVWKHHFMVKNGDTPHLDSGDHGKSNKGEVILEEVEFGQHRMRN